MAKVLVLYYSMYGHVETLAHAVAEGVEKVQGAEVTIKRVPETMQAEAFTKAGGKAQTPRSPLRRNSRITTPLSLALRPVLAICPARCVLSSTRRAACGPPGRCTANWRASLAQPAPAAVRSTPFLLHGLPLLIME